jgi:hypothetical protein
MSKKPWYSCKDFSLKVEIGKNGVVLLMKTYGIVNTKELVWTKDILRYQLPSILESQCFNESGLGFANELQATETGHLFEHILLEYLCLGKIERGATRACHRGRTSWNWYVQPWGTFLIYVDVAKRDKEIFIEALAKSILLMRQIYNMGDQFRSPMFMN